MSRVCIGLPVYNGEAYLAEAVESILNQTFTDFELIISDNCSTDSTEDICRKYSALDSRIQYYRNEQNIGASPNFNRVFELSSSPYFKWAAHDDRCEPTYLERCVEILDADESVVLCHSWTKLIDQDGEEIVVPIGWEGRILDNHNDLVYGGLDDHDRKLNSTRVSERFRSVVVDTNLVHEIFGVIRAEALRETALLRLFYGSDKVLLTELSIKGRFEIIPETLFLNRCHVTQSSQPSSRQKEIWNNPLAKRHHRFPRWHCLEGYFSAATLGPMTLTERIRCYGALVEYIADTKRWRGVMSELGRGK